MALPILGALAVNAARSAVPYLVSGLPTAIGSAVLGQVLTRPSFDHSDPFETYNPRPSAPVSAPVSSPVSAPVSAPSLPRPVSSPSAEPVPVSPAPRPVPVSEPVSPSSPASPSVSDVLDISTSLSSMSKSLSNLEVLNSLISPYLADFLKEGVAYFQAHTSLNYSFSGSSLSAIDASVLAHTKPYSKEYDYNGSSLSPVDAATLSHLSSMGFYDSFTSPRYGVNGESLSLADSFALANTKPFSKEYFFEGERISSLDASVFANTKPFSKEYSFEGEKISSLDASVLANTKPFSKEYSFEGEKISSLDASVLANTKPHAKEYEVEGVKVSPVALQAMQGVETLTKRDSITMNGTLLSDVRLNSIEASHLASINHAQVQSDENDTDYEADFDSLSLDSMPNLDALFKLPKLSDQLQEFLK